MPVRNGVYHTFDNVLKNLVDADFFSELKKDVRASVGTTVMEEMKNAMRDSAYTNVYETYTPTYYIRSGDVGGLTDITKYIGTVNIISDNETEAELQVDLHRAKDGTDLVPIIESGVGYLWENSAIYKSKQARPFLDQAVDTIVLDGSALGAVADYLQRHGWIVTFPNMRLHTPQQSHSNPNASLTN